MGRLGGYAPKTARPDYLLNQTLDTRSIMLYGTSLPHQSPASLTSHAYQNPTAERADILSGGAQNPFFRSISVADIQAVARLYEVDSATTRAAISLRRWEPVVVDMRDPRAGVSFHKRVVPAPVDEAGVGSAEHYAFRYQFEREFEWTEEGKERWRRALRRTPQRRLVWPKVPFYSLRDPDPIPPRERARDG